MHPKYWGIWFFAFILRLLVYLPVWLQFSIGAALGWLFYHLVPGRRSVTQTNIRLCFPKLSKQEQADLVKGIYRNTGIGLFETLIAWYRPKLLQGTLSVEGEAGLLAAIGQNRGVLIVGGGPAGASAAIYAARKGIRTGIVAERFGGQVMDTVGIENFISVPYTEGPKLVASLEQHVKEYEVDVITEQKAASLETGDYVEIGLESGATLRSRSVILATGARWREMNVPGEQEYRGKGVAYCPHCDGPLFKGKRVAVIGGSPSTLISAIGRSAKGIRRLPSSYRPIPRATSSSGHSSCCRRRPIPCRSALGRRRRGICRGCAGCTRTAPRLPALRRGGGGALRVSRIACIQLSISSGCRPEWPVPDRQNSTPWPWPPWAPDCGPSYPARC